MFTVYPIASREGLVQFGRLLESMVEDLSIDCELMRDDAEAVVALLGWGAGNVRILVKDVGRETRLSLEVNGELKLERHRERIPAVGLVDDFHVHDRAFMDKFAERLAQAPAGWQSMTLSPHEKNPMQKDILVIYHSNCLDGFGAALSAWHQFGDRAEYWPTTYGRPAPDVTGKEVYILDFSFDPEVLEVMEKSATKLVLLDHHKSSSDKFHGYNCRCGNKVLFDLQRSGARLAWEHFHTDMAVPPMIRMIEDRDLWHWKLEDTAAFTVALEVAPRTFAEWDKILRHNAQERRQFLEEGKAMQRQYADQCAKIASRAMPVTVAGVQGLMVNATGDFASEVGGLLAEKSGTFGMVWCMDSPTRVKVSLRSGPNFNALELAEQFGGGGHTSACGFTLRPDQLPMIASASLVPSP